MTHSKLKLLYVDISQFGYHTDAYYYAKHLSKSMNVTYIGCHQGKKEIVAENVNVIYIPCKGNILFRHIQFYKACIKEFKTHKYDCVFICYTVFCSILRILFPKLNMIVDVRTSYVEPSKIVNVIFNNLMKFELSFFKNVTFISKELAEFLKFKRAYQVIPVGAELIEDIPVVKFDKLSILYVGTFFGRKMEITIRGFKKFLDSFEHSIPVSYTLIGFGPDDEIKKVTNEIEKHHLSEYVEFKGEIRHPEVDAHFLKSNLGVSFVPITPMYDCQPPTKNFEYLMYGMPIIATATKCNVDFVKPEFGVLIRDTEDGFCEGLKEVVSKMKSFDCNVIKEEAKKYSYEFIVDEILAPFIRSKADMKG